MLPRHAGAVPPAPLRAAVYLAVVVIIIVFGTLITDNVTDGYNIPLSTSTPIFADIVTVVFGV